MGTGPLEHLRQDKKRRDELRFQRIKASPELATGEDVEWLIDRLEKSEAKVEKAISGMKLIREKLGK